MNDNLFSIGDVSRILGITRKIILNYETCGLVAPDAKNGINGNRYYNLERWIKERFIYCDTLFDYTPTTASYVTIRSGVEGKAYLDIETYYPLYITIEWRKQYSSYVEKSA